MSQPPKEPSSSGDSSESVEQSRRVSRVEGESQTRLFFLGLARTLVEPVWFVISLVGAIWGQAALWMIFSSVFRGVEPLGFMLACLLNGVVGVMLLKRITLLSVDLDRSIITSDGLQMTALMGFAFSCLLMGICGGISILA